MGAAGVAFGLGWLLGTALRLRAWWGWWALLWLVGAAGRPGPWRARLLLLLLAVALLTWPPVSYFLPGRGGMGGMREKGRNAETRAERRAREAQAAAKRARLEAVSFGSEPPPRKWVSEPVIPWGPRPRWRPRWHWIPVWREAKGYVTAVVGSGGTGKSYLLVDLAIAALTGGLWLGRPVMRVRSVLYVDSELDADTMKERSWQVARGRGLPRPPGPSRWWQLPLAWVRPWGLHYLALPVSVATEEGMALVALAARRCRADVVLFDSLTIGSAGVALADADGWNAVLSGMERWGRPTVCIDHTPKSGNGQVGSFMKHAKIRGQLELEKQANGDIAVEHSKPQFGAKLPDWTVRPVFDPGAAGGALVRFDALDAQGRPVTREPSPAAPQQRWGKREQAVLDAYARRGPCTAAVVVEHLAPLLTEQDVWKATAKLVKGEALVPVGTVPPASGRGRPAVRYQAVATLTTEQRAVAQAEALLRAHHPRGAGGAGG